MVNSPTITGPASSTPRKITGGVANGFRIRFYGAPTGGTVIWLVPVAPGSATTEELTLTFGDNAAMVSTNLIALTQFTNTNIQALAGGPLPNPIDVFLGDDLPNYNFNSWTLKPSTGNSLTGGTNPTPAIEPIYIDERTNDKLQNVYDGTVVYDGVADKTSGSSSGTYTANQPGHSIGDGICAIVDSGLAGTPFTITSATEATPIVCTKVAHGLNSSIPQLVTITGGTGMTAINGTYYAKCSSPYDADTFGLFYDVGATIPVVGVGTYDGNSATVNWYADGYPGNLVNKKFALATSPLTGSLDTDSKRIAAFVFNANSLPETANFISGPTSGIGAYSAAHSKDLGFQIPPGYSTVLSTLPCATGLASCESAKAGTETVLFGPYYYPGQFIYESTQKPKFYLDAYVWLRKSVPILVMIADDGTDSWVTYGHDVLREFPKLYGKLSHAIISDNCTTPATSGYMTPAQLQAVINEGLVAGCVNHSKSHVAAGLETGAYAAGSGTSTCFILAATAFGAYDSGKPGCPNIQFTFSDLTGTPTTTTIPCGGSKIQAKDLVPAINAALVGTGVTCTVTTLHSNSGIVNTTQKFRLTFSQAIAKPTLTVNKETAATTAITLSYAYTPALIQAEYDACRTFLLSNGLDVGGSSSCVPFPFGQYGAATHAAMIAGGYHLGWCAPSTTSVSDGTTGIHATPLSAIANVNPFTIGRADFTMSAHATPALKSQFKTVLGDAIRYGGIATMVIHTLHATTTTQGGATAVPELRAFLKFASDNFGKFVDILSPAELYDHVRGLASSSAAWTRAYGAQ